MLLENIQNNGCGSTIDGIAEMGNHDELMKLQGIYYKLNQV